ncbi:hypothetical protein [Streptomyces sp. NPDC047014]|uniref:hypothetical protein n=1 Tax=Streptomyces sp. NPDC047014 TaxID=3155736 RepID=UPI00340E61CF
MADERDRWLDKAAADALLRGGPAEPVGPAADARGEAARLRAALDALAAVGGPPPAGAPLPGEEAAVAAFRAARGATPQDGAARSAGRGAHEPLVDLGRPAAASASVPVRRRGRTVSFGLAAALASVAAGGLAAAAGAGLLDGGRRTAAGPAPALSVSAEEHPFTDTRSGTPTLTPKLRPTPVPDGSIPPVPSEPPRPPEETTRATPGFGTVGGSTSGSTTTGGTGSAGKDSREEPSTVGGQDGGRETPATGGGGNRDRQRELEGRLKTDLCEDYRKNRLDNDRRERLTRLADGVTRIPAYCASVLGGDTGGPKRRDSPLGGTLRSATLEPAAPMGAPALRGGR